MDIAQWLKGLGLECYEGAFRENHIDAGVLASLAAEDLKDLGVTSVGHRRKLLDAIAGLSAKPEAAAPPPPAAAPPDPPTRAVVDAGERRQVTVLFADLVGYTALSNELDAEDIHALLGSFFELADRAIDEHGGTVDKHIGDCVMGVFGAPVARGNDAERALRAALAIRDAMPALARRVGRAIGVHVGVASGQVVASDTGSTRHLAYTVTGESVNLASRLAGRAGNGEILISSAVHGGLAERLDCSEVGTIEVKGFSTPVPVWQLLGFRDAAATDRQPLVGRRNELHQFRAALAACGEVGQGQSIHVRGEAGIGKTRLIEEFQREATQAGFACHTGLVLDFGMGTGRDAVRVIARALLGLGMGSDQAGARVAVDDAMQNGLVLVDELVYLNDLLELPQPTELRALYDAMDNASRNRGKRQLMAELVRRASRSRPRLLVIEDVHWADQTTLEHLAGLVEAVAGCAALLVMTTRIEGDPLDRTWRSRISGHPLVTIDLGPLRRDDALTLAGSFMNTANQVVERCIERAAGNPLFLEQLLRHAEDNAETTVPGSVQNLVQARLDRLPPADKKAVQAASVLGQRFDQDTLRYLIDEPGYDCTNLARHFLVRPQGDGFLFAHALVREGVYDSLLKSRRRELHRKAAAWFAGRDLVLRARHLDRAEDQEAPRAYLAAAQSQADEYRYDSALNLLRRGLDLAQDNDTRFALAHREGDMLRELGSTAASLEVFERALALAEADEQRCRAWIGLVAGMRVADRIDEAFQLLDTAEPVARANGLQAELSQIHYYRGSLYFPRGNIDGCVQQHQLSLDHATRAGLPERQALALSGLGDGYYAKGWMKTARDYFRRCLDLCDEHGLGRVEAANRFMIATVRRYLNELDGALKDALASAELAARVGHQRAEIISRLTAGWILIDQGELDAACEQAERGLAVARALGAKRFEPFLTESLASVRLAKGDRAGAAMILENALEQTRALGALTFIGPWLLGTFARATDDAERRRAALAEATALLEGRCVGHNYFNFYRNAIDASLENGEWDGADSYAAALEAYTSAEPVPWGALFIARGRGLAAYGRGRREPALLAELRRLRSEAETVGFKSAVLGFPEIAD